MQPQASPNRASFGKAWMPPKTLIVPPCRSSPLPIATLQSLIAYWGAVSTCNLLAQRSEWTS